MIKTKHKLYISTLIASALVSLQASALTYQSSTDVEFTLNPTLNVTLSSSDLTIDNLVPGSSSDSNVITASVSTNAGYGYYLSATAGTKTGNTDLTNGSSNSKFTNLSSTATTLNDIPADHWGYSYSQDDGTTWVSGNADATTSGYNGLPLDNDDSGATGVMLLRTDSFSNSGSVKFKIGAKASSTQASGTYTNTVNFYAVANPEPTLGPVDCEPRKICYNVNSLTTTEGSMGRQEKNDSNGNITDGSTVTLLASNFSRTGYGFAGWSDTYDYSGNLYGPQETITAPTGTTANGLSLYAIWIKSEGSLQDSTKVAQVCNRLTAASSTTKTLNSVSALTDQRDNDAYAIAKLADGKCWMIENLRLEADDTRTPEKQALAQGYGTSTTYGNFSGLANAESANFSNSTTANSIYYSGTQEGTASIDIGTSNYPAWRMPRYNNWNNQSTSANRPQNPTTNSATNSTTNAGMYSYGNYYTWHAAIADLTYNGTNNQSTTGTSLCPTGWHLPKGGNNQNTANNEFLAFSEALIGAKPANYDSQAYPYYTGRPEGTDASNKLRAYPNNFLYSGYFNTSSAYNRGSYGRYWSSSAYGSDYSYRLTLDSSRAYPGTDVYDKYYGSSIRCTASAGS